MYFYLHFRFTLYKLLYIVVQCCIHFHTALRTRDRRETSLDRFLKVCATEGVQRELTASIKIILPFQKCVYIILFVYRNRLKKRGDKKVCYI